MVSAAAAKVLGALFKIPLTNMLGGVGMSCFSAAYSLFMPVYALTVTGISSAVAKMTAQSAALGMHENALRIRRTALLIFSAVGLIGSAFIFLLAKPFSLYIADSPEAETAVMTIAPAVLFGCISAVERGYYEGLCNMYPTALSQVVEGFVKVGAGLFLCGAVIHHSELVAEYFPRYDTRTAAAAAGILGVTLSTLGSALFFAVLRSFVRPEVSSDRTVLSDRIIARELIRTALPIGTGAVVTNISALIDMWTIIALVRPSVLPEGVTVADYPHFVYGSFAGIALTVFNLVPSVTNMLGKGALTCVTSAWECCDRRLLQRNTSQIMLSAAFISVPAAFGIAALAPSILGTLFPMQTDEAMLCVAPLRLLMAGMVLVCMTYPLFSMLQGIGKAALTLKIMLVGTAVKLVGNVALIPLMNINGAALSTSLSCLVMFVWAASAYFGITKMRADVRSLLGILYSGIMCGAAALLVSGMLPDSTPLRVLILSAAAGGGVFIFAAYTIFGERLRGFFRGKPF